MKKHISALFICLFSVLGANELVNPSLEALPDGTLPGWNAFNNGKVIVDRQQRHSGSCSVKGKSTADAPLFGIRQVLTYDKPSTTPIMFGGWAKLQSIRGGGDFNVYLDIFYEDGTNLWAVTSNWERNRQDWQQTVNCVYPQKPVAKIEVYVLLRKTVGVAWFDDIFLERKHPDTQLGKLALYSLTPFYPHSYILTGKAFNRKATCDIEVVGNDGEILAREQLDTFEINRQFRLSEKPRAFRIKVRLEDKSETISLPPPQDDAPKTLTAQKLKVWTADSMTFVTPQDPPPQNPAKDITLELARKERESAQILVTAGSRKLTGLNLILTQLTRQDGTPFKGTLAWQRVAYLLRPANSLGHPFGLDRENRWLPDPLLPPQAFDVAPNTTQALWITACANAGNKPGRYAGKAILKQDDKTLEAIPLAIQVFDVTLPKTFSLPTSFAIMDGFLKLPYPKRPIKQLRREAWDIMLDHRLNPDDISRTTPPELDDLLHARQRGMNRFNILNLVPRPKEPVLWVCRVNASIFTPEFTRDIIHRLTPVIRELRKHDLMKYAYVYGFDEVTEEYFQRMGNLYQALKTTFPDLKVLTTSAMYQLLAENPQRKDCFANDWYCPLSNHYDDHLSRQLRKQGKKVWWYVCCGPEYPYANFASLEFPAIEARILAWQTFQHQADGLLYWHVNYWQDQQKLDETQSPQPHFPLTQIQNTVGDGILIYPGQTQLLPSIRLANLRDASEDYDYLTMLGQDAMPLCQKLSPTLTSFSRDPKLLRELRRQAANLIRQKK